MCGIAGIVGPHGVETLRAMTRMLVHRGPDDEGYYRDAGVGLGVRRLRIIDLPGGRQPMPNEDGTLHVVFNGEIYNYRELRGRLEKRGHCFRSQSDTEVLVHLYEEFGDAGIHLLRGMFAFALWDGPKERLLLARDRLGIKPMYFAEVAGGLVFASEAKAILEHPGVSREVDPEALDLYLTLQYVPGPRTIWRMIRKLPPGHLLVAERGRVEVRRYWDVSLGGVEDGFDMEDAAEEFRERLEETVRLHLVSDVPLGVLLSGGIDSSSIAALMKAAGHHPLRTFTVGFDLPGIHNEFAEARRVSRHLGSEHLEVIVRPDAAALLPQLIWHLDEPLADAAALPTFLLCRAVREHVTVVLTGEGGDELLAGYPRYPWFAVARRLQSLVPARIREGLLLPLARLLAKGNRWKDRAENLLTERDDATRQVRWVANLSPEIRAMIYSRDLRPLAAAGLADRLVMGHLREDSNNGADIVHRLMALDMKTWLVDDVLTKMDRMSMAASVEARVPFLDHRLLEFVATLPAGIHMKSLGTKHLLRRAMGEFLPPETISRRKHAFLIPLDQWLRGPLAPFLREVLLSERASRRGWFDPARVRELVVAYEAGRGASGQAMWNLLCLELWARVFLDRECFEGVPG